MGFWSLKGGLFVMPGWDAPLDVSNRTADMTMRPFHGLTNSAKRSLSKWAFLLLPLLFSLHACSLGPQPVAEPSLEKSPWGLSRSAKRARPATELEKSDYQARRNKSLARRKIVDDLAANKPRLGSGANPNRYVESSGDDYVKIVDFKNAPLDNVLEAFADLLNIRLIVPEHLKGSVTLHSGDGV
ncbi:MAG: hypothetical protein PVG60_08000, partial [Desulfarculaceae bacterium]